MLLWVLNPRLVLHLAQQGHSATAIGVFSAIPYISIMGMTPLLPRLSRRFSMKALFLFSTGLETLLLLGYIASHRIEVWYLIALLAGLAGAVVWTLSESMIALDAPEGMQGRYMGIYQTIMGCAMAVGPVLAAQLPFDLDGVVALVFGAYVVLVVTLAVAYHWPTATPPLQASGHVQALSFPDSVRLALQLIPMLLVASLVGGVFEGGLDNLGIVVALPHFDSQLALYVPAVIAVGSLLAQVPLGHWADARGSRWVMGVMAFLLAVVCTVFAVLFPIWPWVIWIIAPIWGACGGSMYTLAMTLVSQDGKDQRLVASMGLLVLCYSAGKVVGPVLGGAAYDWAGPAAMGMVFATIAALGAWWAQTPPKRNLA